MTGGSVILRGVAGSTHAIDALGSLSVRPAQWNRKAFLDDVPGRNALRLKFKPVVLRSTP
jgi:hypothetical protein